MSVPVSRPGWRHRPVDGRGGPEVYEKDEAAMDDGFALSLQVVRHSTRWWASVNMRAGMHGAATSAPPAPLPTREAAMRAVEEMARSLGHRLIELGTPAPDSTTKDGKA